MTSGSTIFALVTEAFGGRGGIAQYNRDFLGALAGARPADVTAPSIIVLPRHAPERRVPPAGIEELPPRSGRFAYSLAALGVARARRVDCIFCGHLYMAPLAALIARLRRAKLIVQMHGIEAWSRPTKLRRAAVEAADLVLCVSRHTRARVLSWAAIEPERVVVVPNTVGEAFTPGDASAPRAGWGLAGQRVLLTVARMDARERYKGQDRVIRALPQLVAAGQDVIYVLLGEGDDVARLKSVALATGVADRVRFMGAADQKTVVETCRMADLFVMPSTGEGFGIAFLEAMASGLPALGLAVGGAPDALGDGELGIAIAEPEVASSIAAALARPKVSSRDLANAVRARFGREAFTASALAANNRLQEPA